MKETEFQLQIVKEREQGIDDAIARIKGRVLCASNRLESHIMLHGIDETAFVKYPRVKEELAEVGLRHRYWSESDKNKNIDILW